VYPPPSYSAERRGRYPVVYSLHGYGINAERWDSFFGTSAALERAFAAGAREFIVVAPNAQTIHLGGFYSNSVTTGDWEGFLAEDLAATSTRTIARSRIATRAESAATQWVATARCGW
jgi:hypothetical protein